ncbi:hypothetical protein KWI07_17770 [Enterobacter bugandensis]|uniref:hypothetical protein n=1 Tax=Enterobacter bugandensis TaxID=881260 RepID=UPI0021CEF48E|nr:hypothetical protein [Enterobacter bugandensis]MCU6162276.1 hypothetical protein [Enterobacter bugandensis]
MQQHVLFSRKNKLIAISAAGILAAGLLAGSMFTTRMHQGVHIECRGQIHSVFGDNQTLPEFRGIYTFTLEGTQGYISVNGTFISSDKTYTVQRITRVSTESFSEDKMMHELRSVDVKILTGDNLPEELYQRYIFSPIAVITVDRTLEHSYLIRNLYAPVLVCAGN